MKAQPLRPPTAVLADDRRDLRHRFARQLRRGLFKSLTEQLGDVLSAEELDIHFTHMPARYWLRATESSVHRHLRLIHQFFAQLGAADSAGTSCIVDWHPVSDRHITVVEVCTWDRLGLLAKVAGAFASVGLNIVRADIFTRADNLVLDVFEVCEPNGGHVRNESILREMSTVLAKALQPGGALPKLPVGRGKRAADDLPDVQLDVSRGDNCTAMMVESRDRVGLLHDIFTTLAGCNVNVAHAIITTDNGRAADVFYLTNELGREITDAGRLEEIRQCTIVACSR